MRPGFCRKNHQRRVRVLGERSQDGLQRAGQTWWKAGAHSHMAQTSNKDTHITQANEKHLNSYFTTPKR